MILVLYQIETTVDKRTTDPRVMRLQYSVWKIRATAIFIKTTEVRVIKSPLRHVPRTLLVRDGRFKVLSALVQHVESDRCTEGIEEGTGSIGDMLHYLWLQLS